MTVGLKDPEVRAQTLSATLFAHAPRGCAPYERKYNQNIIWKITLLLRIQ